MSVIFMMSAQTFQFNSGQCSVASVRQKAEDGLCDENARSPEMTSIATSASLAACCRGPREAAF
jgi:hypothetical protein